MWDAIAVTACVGVIYLLGFYAGVENEKWLRKTTAAALRDSRRRQREKRLRALDDVDRAIHAEADLGATIIEREKEAAEFYRREGQK